MQTITVQLNRAFRAAIAAAIGVDTDPLISVSQNPQFGDYQSNAAMGLAKQVTQSTGQKTNPRAIAEQIKSKLNLGEMAEDISLAGPGFINVRLSPRWLADQLQLIETDPRLGLAPTAEPQGVVVDYSGPNIAKEMHVGHLRSTIIGDAISRIIELQEGTDNVIRQNHIGDWGTQFGMLIAYGVKEHIFVDKGQSGPMYFIRSSDIEDLEGFYRSAKILFDTDPTFQEEARQTVVRLQQGMPFEKAAWSEIVDQTRKSYQPVYQALGVKLTVQAERGESFYNRFLKDVVDELHDKQIATESEGATVVFVPGYENPLIIQKSDGGYLYGTTDLAAIKYRVEQLHAHRIIYTHDSRQAQHFAQVFWTAQQAGWANGVELDYAPFGTMLGEDGKPFKTRSGGTVKLKDLLREAEQRAFDLVSAKNPDLPEVQRRDIARAVGIGGVKYADLSKDRTSDYVFSWDKMLALDGNTAPYLQYAYARIQSIFRKAESVGLKLDRPFKAPLQLDSPFELNLGKHLLRLGDVIELVARELKPHYLCAYLYELATRFSSFFENCPVLQSEDPLRASRLALCELTGRTMALGLNLLGIEHPGQM